MDQQQVTAVDAAALYRDAMPEGELLEFSTAGLDRVGVPAYAVQWAPERGFKGGLGYGIDDRSARLSAWGELAEAVLLASVADELPARRASYAQLRREVGEGGVVDPLRLCLEAGTDYDEDRPLDWTPLTRWTTGEQVLVPVDVVASEPAGLPRAARTAPPGGRLTTLITNGQGAGDTVSRALGHALAELLQRDGNGLRFRALDEGVVLDLGPDDSAVSDPAARRGLQQLRAAGIDVVAKLAAVENGVCNVFVVGADDDPPLPLMVTAAGEAAHPDRDVALRKAVLEFAAARSRKAFMHGPLDRVAALAPEGYLARFTADPAAQEPRALAEMVGWLGMSTDQLRAALEPTVLSRRSTVDFADLPRDPAAEHPHVLCDRLVAGLTADGFDVLVLVARRGDAVAVKAVVPGLEVETMSYGRIGERGVRSLLARGDGRTGVHGLVGLGPAPETAAPVLLTPDAQDRLGGRPWFDRAAADRVIGPLYPLYREPARHAAPAALGRLGA
ncbi:ribosomal protein S12 methylthiotransferase accessory factor [Motilibacter peucedani]|uniref:Ribosomal protein S12 methylthiotransferase accessory factor n=1 Tax=Motilibacter peucedani TaxID=598650 RepID=A0A420XV54_9ACTN|nr:YcaO-like family protein [Motilibacter peucedani]RKS80725.1 ribosomal protein S12 methylthiotransferase accessory factor [Motilibacter peucedani]